MPLLFLLLSVWLLNWSAVEARAAPKAADAAYKMWVGKYPSDRVDGKSFLQQADVQRRVKSILGDKAIAEMREMTVSGQILGHRDWLLASGCQKRFCPYGNWTVGINLISGDTWACVAAMNSETLRYGSSKIKPVQLPRKMEEPGCPDGDRTAERFDVLFPAEKR